MSSRYSYSSDYVASTPEVDTSAEVFDTPFVSSSNSSPRFSIKRQPTTIQDSMINGSDDEDAAPDARILSDSEASASEHEEEGSSEANSSIPEEEADESYQVKRSNQRSYYANDQDQSELLADESYRLMSANRPRAAKKMVIRSSEENTSEEGSRPGSSAAAMDPLPSSRLEEEDSSVDSAHSLSPDQESLQMQSGKTKSRQRVVDSSSGEGEEDAETPPPPRFQPRHSGRTTASGRNIESDDTEEETTSRPTMRDAIDHYHNDSSENEEDIVPNRIETSIHSNEVNRNKSSPDRQDSGHDSSKLSEEVTSTLSTQTTPEIDIIPLETLLARASKDGGYSRNRPSIEEVEELSDSIQEMDIGRNIRSSAIDKDVTFEDISSSPEVIDSPPTVPLESPKALPAQYLSAVEIQRMRDQLAQKEMTARMVGLKNLPDGGTKLTNQIRLLKMQLEEVDKQKGAERHPLAALADQRSPISIDLPGPSESAVAKPVVSKSFAHLSEDELRRKVQSTKWALGTAMGAQKERLRDELRDLETQLLQKSLANATRDQRPGLLSQSQKPGGVKFLADPPKPPPQHLTAQQRRLLSDQPAPELYQRTDSGRITAASKRLAETVTLDALENLHASLASCPGEDAREPTPAGLVVPLMPHQERGLKWLLWRETQSPPGGILADDMGLGKTLNMIALIVAQKEREPPRQPGSSDIWLSKTVKIKKSTGTLVVCPASVVGQWENEIIRRCKRNALSVVQFHGKSREKLAHKLHEYDVVITTYQIIQREIGRSGVEKGQEEAPIGDFDPETQADELRQSVLLRIAFDRIILDEGHVIRNPKAAVSMAVCRLRAVRRWVVTGTPVQNKELDMYSLLRFLRVSPFDQLPIWKRWVDSSKARSHKHAVDRLQLLMKTLLLRRTKDQKVAGSDNPLVAMPKKNIHTHDVQLSESENEVYQKILDFSREALEQYIKNQEKKMAEEFGIHRERGSGSGKKEVSKQHILLLLLRLRQVCSHPALIRTMLDQQEAEEVGEGGRIEDDDDEDLISKLGGMAISGKDEADGGKKKENFFSYSNPVFDRENVSSKMKYIIDEVRKVIAQDQKAVVVSQWTSMLEVFAQHFNKLRIRSHLIAGNIPLKQRTAIVEDFNTNPRGPPVMLLSLCAGGVGLNLIGGNHLFLADMHWNPQLEAQACDRVYRVGQKKDVHVHRMITKGTVEERIMQLQQKKLEMANGILTGAAKIAATGLTLNDLKMIFMAPTHVPDVGLPVPPPGINQFNGTNKF